MNDYTVERIECHILMSEAIRNFEDVETLCSKVFQIREYKNKLPDELYKKIEQFMSDVILPLIYDADYYSFLKEEKYGTYNENGHFIIDSDRSLEMMIFKKYFHIQNLLDRLNLFAYEELDLDYDC